jgi:hypothetical protein
MPFQTSPCRDDGYDVADYYNVDPRYGTLGDFIEFTHGAKQRGVRVLIAVWPFAMISTRARKWNKKGLFSPATGFEADPPTARSVTRGGSLALTKLAARMARWQRD